MHHAAGQPLLAQLAHNSAPYRDPLTELEWHALDRDGWWLPPDTVSLAGVAEYEALPECSRRALSRQEFMRMLRWGLWLEACFIERLGHSLVRAGEVPGDLVEREIHLHEIREEAGHGLMFLRLMRESRDACASFRPGARLVWLSRGLRPGSLAGSLARLIGEDIPDKVNRHVRSHGEGCVCPVVRGMVTRHVIEEARHIAHARHALEAALEHRSRLHRAWLGWLGAGMLAHFERRYFYPDAGVYQAAGLPAGVEWERLAHGNPRRHDLVRAWSGPLRRYLATLGL